MQRIQFRDRTDAGRRLAAALSSYAGRSDLLVLALPRGGVPIGYEVARALRAPLDVILVRKLGVPGHEELAMGAIASGGVRIVSQDVVASLGIPDWVIAAAAASEEHELARRAHAYRDELPSPPIAGRTVLLVDDGLATGSTMRAAAAAVRSQGPSRVVVAVPTAPGETCRSLRDEVDEVVCLSSPEPFVSVGGSYENFSQTTDEEVRALLERAATARAT
jgi:putative phosphoribosyl transferase